MTVMQIVGALAMMASGTALGTRCAMGFLRRYGWAHRPWWRGVLMVAPAAILFTRGLTAIQGIQPLTPWGETVAVVLSIWWTTDLLADIVGGWRREGVRATAAAAMASPPLYYQRSDLRRPLG